MENIVKFGVTNRLGSIWDECVGKCEIMQLMISYGNETINSFKFSYVKNGKVCHTKIHGEPNGFNFTLVCHQITILNCMLS